MEILKGLITYDLLDFKVVNFHDTVPNEIEFTVALERTKTGTPANVKLRSIPKIADPPETRDLQAKIEELEKDLHDVYTSKSWRITKPMREMLSKTVHRSKTAKL